MHFRETHQLWKIEWNFWELVFFLSRCTCLKHHFCSKVWGVYCWRISSITQVVLLLKSLSICQHHNFFFWNLVAVIVRYRVFCGYGVYFAVYKHFTSVIKGPFRIIVVKQVLGKGDLKVTLIDSHSSNWYLDQTTFLLIYCRTTKIIWNNWVVVQLKRITAIWVGLGDSNILESGTYGLISRYSYTDVITDKGTYT